ncbi:MAG: hypothetical protein ACHQWU_04125 [Gemmatimonadales bacterium]
MSIRCGGLLALVINASVICRTVAAQQPRSNTTLVRTVVEGTLARIAPELTDFVFRQQPEPWRLVSPDTTDSLWMVAFRGLRELLHAQAPRPNSDHEHYLEVRELVAGSRSFEVRVARCEGTWQVLPSGPWIDEDPGLCGP